MYAVADPETEPGSDAAANFQAIEKPKIFADEQFVQNIAQMMQQAKEIQDQVEKERLKKLELEDYIKKEIGRKLESELSLASKRVASRLSMVKMESLEAEVQQNETIEVDEESSPAPQARSSPQRDSMLPDVNIKRTHEINELVSKEELALLLSDDFLFGKDIQVDDREAKQIEKMVKKKGNQKSELAPGHDGAVERAVSASQLDRTGSPGMHGKRQQCCQIRKQNAVSQQKGLKHNVNYHLRHSVNVTANERFTQTEKEQIRQKKMQELSKYKQQVLK